MSQKIKKYYYSVHLPDSSHKGMEVVNATHMNDSTYVVTTNKDNPILRFDTNKEAYLTNPKYLNIFSKLIIKFISFIKDKLAVVLKHKWNICVYDKENGSGRYVTIDSNENLKHKIVESILKKYPKSCHCQSCYHLCGFIDLHNFNMFIQLSCVHKSDHKLLYIVKCDINSVSLECSNIEVTNEYNYQRLFLDYGLSERDVKACIFTGLYYNNGKVYLISNNGRYGYLWEMDYLMNISYLAPLKLVTKLRRQPRGIYVQDSKLIVLCNNIKNRKMNYYMIQC